MRFDRHLFISYAHLDNQPISEGEPGWVSRLHDALEALVSMRLGGEARIWRDAKLQGNDDFGAEIVDQFTNTAVLVAVLTPRYLNSEWCTREIREFCEAADKAGGAVVDNKSRVFKVIKTPVSSQDSLPTAVKDVLGYEFFVLQDDDTPLELDPAYGPDYAQGFTQKVATLAWQVSQLVSTLEVDDGDEASTSEASAKTGKPTVYLAECSSDRRDERDRLEGELRRLGHPVLPDRRLPSDEAEYVQAVEGMLERAAVAIHLVGENYGLVPDGDTIKSATILQNELAAARSRAADLRRVIWLPEGTSSDQAPQQAFLSALHTDPDAQFGADLVTDDFEGLRVVVHTLLDKIEAERARPEAAPAAAATGVEPRVYVLCDQEDRKATVPVRKHLAGLGIEVDLPAFDGDAARVREANQALLRECDAVLVFYGTGDEAWKRTVDNELRKLPGYLAGAPMPAVWTYLAEPRTPDKDDLVDMEEPNLVVGFDGFDEALLAGLVRDARPAADAE